MVFNNSNSAWILWLLVLSCSIEDAFAKDLKASPPSIISWTLIKELPHDANAFTQGLEVWEDGYFLESTGQYGKSDLRKVEIKTGKVIQSTPLDSKYFGEGATIFKGKVVQLTWQEGVILKWSFDAKNSFTPLGSTPWKGEGWGITKGQGALWVSNGTSDIQEIDPSNLRVKRTISVTLNGQPMDRLNELEFINGSIFANVWMTSTIVRFSPKTGIIDGLMDVSTLVPKDASPNAVANGIAWDVNHKKLYITGKLWPNVFEVKFN